MKKQGSGRIQRLINATRYSAQGIASAWRNEAAFRQEAAVILPLLPLALWIGETAAQRALLILSALLVIIVELLNSAIEAAVDRIGETPHPLAGQAKDMGSAAVLFSLVTGAVVWGLVIWERLGSLR
ncbi:MAG: diacylglycerol kinase [Desulfatitalea sp.]|nr:diacylglycerol kinase [Desulfatitalea sp.]NNJ99262.1 diacylglycerol kinase [Desulfatitalea sp.]